MGFSIELCAQGFSSSSRVSLKKKKDVPWERNSYCIQRGMKEGRKEEREWCIRSRGREGDGWNFDNVGTEHVLPQQPPCISFPGYIWWRGEKLWNSI